MRSEQAMLELIVSTAQHDDRIRAVIMNGSRTNPNARRDPFQDFDIVYVVTEVESFKDDPRWIDRFGERMILQLPELMQDPPPQNNGTFIYLMQFMDGNRIDLTTPVDFVCTVDAAGGNSGSAVVDRDLRVVGLLFDGNLESLGNEFFFGDRVERAVCVHPLAIELALNEVYDAAHLVRELRRE